jgi:hypothetical protein
VKVDGGCLCGHITYEAEVDPASTAICHCSDCQTHSGTSFGVVVGVENGDFRLLSGRLKTFDKIAESGRTRALSFCPECGTRIHAVTIDDPAAFFGLRVGTIRQRDRLIPQSQVWCRSAQDWVFDLAAIPRRETQSP